MDSSTIHNVRITTPSPEKSKFPARAHCERVAALLPMPGLIYLASAPSQLYEDSDMPAPFRQRRYFQYLSGATTLADSHLVYNMFENTLTLFIPPLNPSSVLWSGFPPSCTDLERTLDIDFCRTTPDLISELAKIPSATIYCLHASQSPQLPGLTIDTVSLRPAIDDCRVLKDPTELALLRKANAITAAAHTAVMRAARHAHSELDLHATFLSSCAQQGAFTQSYAPIIGSGRNAATLHYIRNDAPLLGRQLVLVDCGAEWQGYASDVTRTFPLSGTWSPEAAGVNRIVVEMQTEAIKRTVTGTPWIETHLLAHRIALTGLMELGILKGDAEDMWRAGATRAFFPHGLGHMMGLDVHDVDGTTDESTVWTAGSDEDIYGSGLLTACGREVSPRFVKRVFRPGMVVTVEPGIYFCEFVLRPYINHPSYGRFFDEEVLDRYWDVGGVRIEDDILVLESGNENLTTAPTGEEMLRIVRGEKE